MRPYETLIVGYRYLRRPSQQSTHHTSLNQSETRHTSEHPSPPGRSDVDFLGAIMDISSSEERKLNKGGKLYTVTPSQIWQIDGRDATTPQETSPHASTLSSSAGVDLRRPYSD
ncbi:uncharacterized protein LDX57_010564 [Aspergillus melleus]|uniref:uncharacterized protein n=1 Tax=Aspergillus melleus TaxID=138277 RepID=UPI001E8C9FB5|nr:uncharacterized protein LDX57_010564 [Aspergillus melleus]KAH8432931.1 hypothetical protein LDX57_010564 [Aspergillus melleus]